VRNTVIKNFNSLDLREDVGKLWENFVIVERLKTRTYGKIYANQYFWRTWEQQEIDLIEEREGHLFAYEIKWKDKKVSPPQQWLKAYPKNTHWQLITPTKALKFISL
jgi:uncharacterized protein